MLCVLWMDKSAHVEICLLSTQESSSCAIHFLAARLVHACWKSHPPFRCTVPDVDIYMSLLWPFSFHIPQCPYCLLHRKRADPPPLSLFHATPLPPSADPTDGNFSDKFLQSTCIFIFVCNAVASCCGKTEFLWPAGLSYF